MKYVKTALWIFMLSVLYSTGILRMFNISAELLFCFSGVYSILNKNLKNTVIVSLVCGIIMSALGGRGFVFSVLTCVYFALLFLMVTPKKKLILKITAIVFLTGFIFESGFYLLFCFDNMLPADAVGRIVMPSALYNTVVFLVLYLGVKKSFTEKERYIF